MNKYENRYYRLIVGLIWFATCYIRVFFKFQNPYVEICSHSDAKVIPPLLEHNYESFRLTMKTRDVGEPMKCLKIVNWSRHFVVQPQSPPQRELKSEVLIPYRYDYCRNYLVSPGSASIRIYQIRKRTVSIIYPWTVTVVASPSMKSKNNNSNTEIRKLKMTTVAKVLFSR